MLLRASEKILKDGTKILIQRLEETHHRGAFTCSRHPVLADFLNKHALQNANLGLSRTYVVTLPESNDVIGFCSLSNGSISPKVLPNEGKGLPRYDLPTAHIGRFAIDDKWQCKGLGGTLLFFALEVIVDASERLAAYV
ncbi:MAG: hypothetical protein JOZ57_15840, partial [Abitibacteriaceae bacterium]|nr:hypothetical protein [Abditibacteriaceae bacterium]